MNFYSLSTTRTLSKNDVTIKNDILTLEISDTTVTAIGTTNAVGTFNLAELVQKYSQDHGCIALFPKAMHIPDTQEFMAMETTQLSLSEKGGGDPGMRAYDTVVADYRPAPDKDIIAEHHPGVNAYIVHNEAITTIDKIFGHA